MQPLTSRALQKLDDLQLNQINETRAPLTIAVPARDLTQEFRKQSRLDSEAARKLRSHRPQPGKLSPRKERAQLAWEKRGSPSSRPRRSSTPANTRSSPIAAPPRRWSRAASPSAKFWTEYVQRPVVERLSDMTRWEGTISQLHDEERKRIREECPFEPALSIATVMGTHAGAKRNSQSEGRFQNNVPSPLAHGSSVRVVTIRAPTDHLSSESDDEVAVPRERIPEFRESGPPHFMLPLPIPPPSAPQPPLALTPRGAAKKRSIHDLKRWAEARDAKRKSAVDARQENQRLGLSEQCLPWSMSTASTIIVEGMADRRLDVYAPTDMNAMARASVAKQRITQRLADEAKDVRRVPRKVSDSPRLDLKWFVDAVRSDDIWTNRL